MKSLVKFKLHTTTTRFDKQVINYSHVPYPFVTIFDKETFSDYSKYMNKIVKIFLCWLIVLMSLMSGAFLLWTKIAPQAYAQSTQDKIDAIKLKIKSVVAAADGKVTSATKTRLIELISNKIKASPNVIITDIYVYFLKEVKRLRTSDQVIAITDVSSAWSASNQTNTSASNGPDFSISYANIDGAISLDQKFATISVKLKNNGSTYISDGLGSLKFGCKWLDWAIYPYRSYVDNTNIGSNSELVLTVSNVYIANLTSTKGFKLLACKIDSSDLISESNEDNNVVNVSVQIY